MARSGGFSPAAKSWLTPKKEATVAFKPPTLKNRPVTGTSTNIAGTPRPKFLSMNDPQGGGAGGTVIKPTSPIQDTGGGTARDNSVRAAATTSATHPAATGEGPGGGAREMAAAALAAPGTFGMAEQLGSTPFTQGIRPDMMGELWSNPEAIIDLFFREYGLGKGGGDYGTLLQEAPGLGILWMALAGTDALQGYGSFYDFVDAYLQGQRTPGAGISPGAVMTALLNPQAASPIANYLGNPSLTPTDQVNNMLSAARYALDTRLPAPVLSALLSQMDQMGREFVSYRAGNTGGNSFADYLQSRGITPQLFF